MKIKKIASIGVGYLGLYLAEAFQKKWRFTSFSTFWSKSNC